MARKALIRIQHCPIKPVFNIAKHNNAAPWFDTAQTGVHSGSSHTVDCNVGFAAGRQLFVKISQVASNDDVVGTELLDKVSLVSAGRYGSNPAK